MTRLDGPVHEKELFGKAYYKFVKRKLNAPSFTYYTHIDSFAKVVDDRCTEYMGGIGNIERVWHGTSIDNLEGIGRDGLRLGRWGLFGGGIYLTPSATKAMNHAGGGFNRRDYKVLLKCYVARGKVLEAKKNGDHRDRMKDGGYDSLVGTGAIGGAWGGTLSSTEYVVYDPELVDVKEIHIYKKTGGSKLSHWYMPPAKVVNTSVKNHPCKNEEGICKNAYNESGCIVTNRKKGCTKDDATNCKFFDN